MVAEPSIVDKILSYDIVSFDVFDTLIHRTVKSPQDIRWMVMRIYEDRHHKRLLDYVVRRGYAESLARTKSHQEVNLSEIYDCLDYPKDISRELQKIEEQCEIENCLPNTKMIELAERCYQAGKTVIITSDMYLERYVLESILSKIGVRFQRLYLSCEVRKTKKDGDLFAKILSDMAISPDRMIHIGDNMYSDIEMPKRFGINTVLCMPDEKNYMEDMDYLSQSDSSIEANHLKCLFERHKQNGIQSTSPFRIGYTVLGPFLYSFCQWIHECKEKLQIERLLFLARDGYLIYKCYQELYPEDDAEYICLNKNLMRLPSLSIGDGIHNFIKSLPPRYDFSVDEICTHLGIKKSDRNLKEEYRQIPRLLRSDILEGKHDDILNELFLRLKPEIEFQRELLDRYLEQNGFYNKKIGLVNNSMEGSTQLLLGQITKKIGKNIDVYGLQFCASPSCLSKLGEHVKVFFHGKNEPKWWGRVFRSCPLIFEHLVFEPTGTAREFFLDDNGCVAVKKDLYGREKEDHAVKQFIQNEALAFIRDYKTHVNLDIKLLSKRMYFRLFKHPNQEDASQIGGFWDVDVEKTRQINPQVGRVSLLNVVKGHPSIVWMFGYLSQTKASAKKKFMLNVATYFYVYAKRPNWLISDVFFSLKDNIGIKCQKIYITMLKSKYILLSYC